MDAKELRIGNKIYYDNCIVTIIALAEYPSLSYISAHSESNDLYEIDCCEFEPIPLSPEILEKAGFEKYDWQDAYFTITIFGHLYIYFYKERIITRFANVSKDEVGHKMVSLGFVGKQTSSDNIIYLHQLQNLIYSITGEELNINL